MWQTNMGTVPWYLQHCHTVDLSLAHTTCMLLERDKVRCRGRFKRKRQPQEEAHLNRQVDVAIGVRRG